MNIKGLLRRIKYGTPIIVVSGLPRSGTSMIMEMLEAGGVEIVSDGVRTADIDNPEGYYELERIKELSQDKDKSWLRQLRGKAVKIITFFLKDLPDTNNYKILFVERNPREMIISQNKMLIRRGEQSDPSNDEQMLKYFEEHLYKIKKLLRDTSHFEALYLNHHDILHNPEEQAKKIKRFLGRCMDIEKMTGVINPDLYRNRE